MCGIVCYVGREKAKPILMEGLKRLEYRGYDSAGLAIQNKKHIDYYRTVGKIVEPVVGGLDGEAGFADTAGTDQGQQAAVRVFQPLGDFGQFCLAADKRCELRGQVIGSGGVPGLLLHG